LQTDCPVAGQEIRVPDLHWNKSTWGSNYGWHDSGEEWSKAWGGSEAQWFGAIFPRLHRFLPALRILEIAPGFGRWTKFLIPACDEFVGIDLSEKCTDACRDIFGNAKHARFITNDGLSLAAVQDASFDLIFSFDSLVHAEVDVLASYLPQILPKLSPTGVAFLHHSNFLAYSKTIGNEHGRAQTVSADTVADLIKHADGVVLIQEIVNWGCEHLIDCLTLFGRRDSFPFAEKVRLENPLFMGEAKLIQHFQSPYARLPLASEYATPER
jgi:SAM-dependent methyltransferase